MVAGFERYFQIARCFRDEDLRADRQPEFTQLDLEMSASSRKRTSSRSSRPSTRDVRRSARPEDVSPFLRLTYEEAMGRYGTDKPDLRYGLELADLHRPRPDPSSGSSNVVAGGGRVRGVGVPGGADIPPRQIDALTNSSRGTAAGASSPCGFTGEGGSTAHREDVRSPVARSSPRTGAAMAAHAAPTGRHAPHRRRPQGRTSNKSSTPSAAAADRLELDDPPHTSPS